MQKVYQNPPIKKSKKFGAEKKWASLKIDSSSNIAAVWERLAKQFLALNESKFLSF